MRAILALAVAVSTLACGPFQNVIGDGSLVTVERDVTGTAAVHLALPASLTVQLGSPASLRLEGEENLLPFVETVVDNGVLTIGLQDGVTVTPTRPMSLVLTAPAIRGLKTVSSGQITAPALSATTITLDIVSSGGIRVASVDAERLETEIVSSGRVQIDGGRVRHHEVSLRSSGSVTAAAMESTTARVNITSSGSAWLWVTDVLEVTLTSSGSVRYLGTPRVTAKVSSSGTVAPMVLSAP